MSHKTPNHAENDMPCPHALADVDLFSSGAQEHWYDAYPILHREAPVHLIPGEGLTPGTDGYILSKYADVERVVKDPERFTPTMTLAMHALGPDRAGDDDNAFNIALRSLQTLRPNAELWRSHRQELTDPWVGPGAKRHTELITRLVDRLIDNWIDREQLEFVSEFARPLPQLVTAAVLGFPETDIPQLAAWGSAQVMSFVYGKGHRNEMTPQQMTQQANILVGFKDYVSDQVREKRKNPQQDMISHLTQVTYQALDRKLNDEEINGIVYFMLLGGLETTQYALEQQAQLLCEDTALFQKIKANPKLIRVFTEEAMRLRAPTQGLSTRITTRDETFQGVAVPKGSLLHLRWAAGNVDPEAFECPYELDLERKSPGSHLSFSQGPRTCPGAGISRLEQTIAWQRLFQRLESLRYQPGNSFEHQPGIMLGTLELNLEFRASNLV